MKRFFFVLPLTLLALVSLPDAASDWVRARVAAVVGPMSEWRHRNESGELQNLQLENYQLRSQLDLVYDWLSNEKRISGQADLLKSLQAVVPDAALVRRGAEMKSMLQSLAIAAPARILYRDPSSWSSSCWINIGEENNRALGQKIISKNSPVVSGNALVGIVEFVGQTQSRVRFITDSGLKTAVRAVRGSVLERELGLSLDSLLYQLKRHRDYKTHPIVQELLQFQVRLPVQFQDGYFAKGEVMGSSSTYQRSLSLELKGIGFNCDISDAEGSSRDLRDRSVLRPGDLLITSGLDGVFPPGLRVGTVTKVEALQEGAYFYNLKAQPSAVNMADLSSVYVLPPLTTE